MNRSRVQAQPLEGFRKVGRGTRRASSLRWLALRSLELQLLICVLLLATPTQALAAVAAIPESDHGGQDEALEGETLQQRLTERVDKRRPFDPWSFDLAGRPLTLGGEYEIGTDYLRHRGFAAGDREHLLWQQGLELEAFYSFGPALSLFAQLRLDRKQALFSHTAERASGPGLERGEMWLYSADVGGSGIDLDAGRLNFEDDRRWWWDDELDAIRIAHEGGNFEIAVALARELAPRRYDGGGIDPDEQGVRRLIAEASWDWRPDHTMQLFVLHQDDRSPTGFVGQIVASKREDASDARLTWSGARLTGGFTLSNGGVLGYWLDWAQVRGRERLVEYRPVESAFVTTTSIDAIPLNRAAPAQSWSEVDEILDRDVRGWGIDAGINWLLPMAAEPRLFAGIAYGSGDRTPDDGIDRAFRQTGLQANEAGFGGAQRFAQYGALLDPELSNLWVGTLGGGVSLLRSSSLDLVYHRYRLDRPADALRNARFEIMLDERHRDLGSAIDLVLALEEWERFEFGCVLSAFRGGHALGPAQRTWNVGAQLALRVAF